MANIVDQMSQTEVGERLKLAREQSKLTQSGAASHLGLARTTLVAIEQGQRRVRMSELQQFAQIYKTSVNAMLRREAAQVDMAPRFRKLASHLDPSSEEAAELLNTLVRAEMELEELLGVERPHQYPPERPILPGDVRIQAEQDAAELRQWLGLGLAPIADMTSLLELHLGARVFVRRLPSRISGLYAFDEKAGACILLNANHPRERRSQTGAHEAGHLISTRRAPDVLDADTPEGAREERYANAFARALLMPPRLVKLKFQELTAGASHLTRKHVIVLAHMFNISRETLVLRLEELNLARDGTWDWFVANGGITDEQARSVLGTASERDVEKSDADRPVSLRISLLADQAWRRGLLSEGQLARLLHLDRVAVRSMLDDFEESGRDAAPELAL
jgi:Zn-dependent peptidase ImmA (M78 family)/DNA-binding XRE family transcriptional regulator